MNTTPAKETLNGIYDHTIFCNDESGFTVGVLNVTGRKQGTTIVGNFTAIPGETLTLQGEWIHNRKFGEQFTVVACESKLPASLEGLRRYLGSGFIKGIGPVYAERMIERFGVDVPRIIEETPHRLKEVQGIGRTRYAAIVAGWAAQKEIKNIMLFLQGHGVGPSFALKIFKHYGNDAVKKVEENPYRLAWDIHGIGFKTADKIALRMGIEQTSTERIRAGLFFVLGEGSDREGHAYLPKPILVERAATLLEVPTGTVESTLEQAIRSGSQFIFEEAEQAVYQKKLHTTELSLAKNLRKLLSAGVVIRPVQWDKFFEWYKGKGHLDLAEKQKEAVKNAYENKLTVITGGPGTGKSTLIRALTQLLNAIKVPFSLAAPTGRAAKRLAEVTGCEAKTLHRLLEFDPQNWRFKRDEENPLEAEVIILDEASMIDLNLFQHLTRALSAKTRLIVVGDVDQLPSVGPGNVLRDLVACGEIPVVRLSEVYRQAAQSAIILAAHEINQGIVPNALAAPAPDFVFIEKNDPDECLKTIADVCARWLPQKLRVNPLKDVQVLIPMNRGTVGTQNLNVELQKVLNADKPFVERGSRRFSIGDRVIQTRNNYDLEAFNGDIGTVARVDPEEKLLTVQFDTREVTYESSEWDELDLAYAITIHKSQGSEFPVVVLALLNQHFVMLQRNLIYTAVTRGKKMVCIVGSKGALRTAVQNSKVDDRYTRLKSLLLLQKSGDAAM